MRPYRLALSTTVFLALAHMPAAAAPFIGSAADFAVLGLDNGSVIINSATSITGNVGYSSGVTSSTNQKVDSFTGTAYVHSTATFSHTPATFAPSGGIVFGADVKLDQANADALAGAGNAASLTADIVLGMIGDDDNVAVASVGALTVVSIDSLKHTEDTFTITGGANDVFVFNVAGDWDYDNSQIVLNGVSADNILFNFLSATADIRIGKAGTEFYGTILAPDGSVDYHNPATFNGRIIARDINLHSDFNITASLTTVPEAPALGLFGLALAGLGMAARRKR